MAEAVSGVVTLTTFTLAIIRETAIFIRDAREVDVRIQKLLSKLLDLQDWVELIESTCKTAQTHNESVPACVSISLSRCERTLQKVRDTLEGLASRKSGTFYQKVKLKIRTESSKRDVLEAIEDLKHHKSHIKSCMDIWTHQRTANIDRRTSGALPTPQPATNNRQVHQINTGNVPGPFRTLSNASTILEPVFDDTTSTTSSPATARSSRQSHDSVASSGLHPLDEERKSTSFTTARELQSTITVDSELDSVVSSQTVCTDASADPVDLHKEISKHKNDETRTAVIKQLLERHPRSVTLANTKDEYGRTPLCRAAQLGDLRLARTLVEYSADINARDSQPCSVLDHALAQNRESFVAFLIQQGVDQRNVSKQYRDRLEEIKEAIEYRKKKVAKQKGKGRSKNSCAMNTTTRMLTT